MKRIQNSAPDPRHAPVREEIWRVYNEANDNLQCPWSGKHAKILARTLATATNWTAERWHSCILNWFASEGINPAEDPAEWIPRLASYARQPLNRFGGTDHLPVECMDRRRELVAGWWLAHPEEDRLQGTGNSQGESHGL